MCKRGRALQLCLWQQGCSGCLQSTVRLTLILLSTRCAGDCDRAEQLLLASSRPSAAIEMRKQQGHWDRAIALAEHLEPQAVGGMAALRAAALEAEGQVRCGVHMRRARQQRAMPGTLYSNVG